MSLQDTKLNKDISGIINDAQDARANHKRNLIRLKTVYESADFDLFLQCFTRILDHVVRSDFDNPHIKNALEFLAKFVGYTNSGANQEDDFEAEPTDPLLKAVIQKIIEYHDVTWDNCRYNTCRFVSLVLQHAGEQVNNQSVALIQNAMLKNLQDSKQNIRRQAITAVTRLQEPRNPSCPVIRDLTVCLLDSNCLIRRDTVNQLAPTKVTIQKVCERTEDIDANVRAAAFKRVGDIGIKYLKIVQRQFVLKSGFEEKNSYAKKVFAEYLLPKWLTHLNGSYLAFLNAIKLDADEADILYTEELSTRLINLFFKTESISRLIEALQLEGTKLVPEISMTSELALYWNLIVKYLAQDKDSLEGFLQRVMPEMMILCNYIESLIRSRLSKTMEESDYIEFQYLLYNLFDMAEHGDISEEVGRRTLDKLIKNVLRKHRFEPRLLNKIVTLGSKISLKVTLFIDEMCLIISDIWQPLTDQPPNERDIADKEFRIAQVVVKLNILESDQEDAVIEQDFEKAEKLKIEIKENQKKLDQIKAESAPVKQVRIVTEDPETLCWCLDLLASLLAHGNVDSMTRSLIDLRDIFLMPLMENQNVEIAWRTFKCLSLCCIFDRTFAKQHIKRVCMPIASYRKIPNFNKTMLTDAVATVTDLMRLHGAEFFNTKNDFKSSKRPRSKQAANKKRLCSENVDEAGSVNPKLTVDFIINVLLDMLDDESNDITKIGATAIAKLMLNEFAINPMVVARLILKWYNPSTGRPLQQMLGVTINAYTERIPNSKGIIAQAVGPILDSIANAPRTSPLADINIDNVIKFLAAITDSGQVRGLMHVHIGLASILIEEISSRPTEKVTMYFARMLNVLNVTPDDSPAVKELVANAKLLLDRNLLMKNSKRQVVKFIRKCYGQQVKSPVGDSPTSFSGDQKNTQSRKTRKRRKINPSENVK